MTDPPPPSPAAPSAPAKRAGHNPASIALFLLVALAVIGGDLALKVWSFNHVAGYPVTIDPVNPLRSYLGDGSVVVVPNVLSLRLTANTGAVFGLGKGRKWIFVTISLVAAMVIVRLFAKSAASAWAYHLALALVLGGAVGNLYDRIRFNAVRDMLNLFPGVKIPGGFAWPGTDGDIYPWIFNPADAALVVGVLMLVVILSRDGKPRQTDAPAPG